MLIYGAETRPETAKTRTQSQVPEMKFLKKARITRWDRIRNENLRKRFQITDFSE